MSLIVAASTANATAPFRRPSSRLAIQTTKLPASSTTATSCHPSTSPSEVSDGSTTRALVPTCSADWEAKKSIIKELYMGQNLILNDVVEIMQSVHNFKATSRMYKGQFSKWKWAKYNKSGSSNANATRLAKSRRSTRRKTTLISSESRASKKRQPKPSQPTEITQPLPLNEEVGEMEVTLSAYGAYISAWSERETPWKKTGDVTSPLGCPRYQSIRYSILQNMRTALSHFSSNRPCEGGIVLRQTFLQVEDAILSASQDISAVWDCCLAVPQLVLNQEHPAILVIFARFLRQLTALKLPNHPIAQVARCVHRLAAAQQPDRLRDFISSGWRLWVDRVSLARSPTDTLTIHLKRGYVVLQHADASIVGSLIADFARSAERSLAARGEAATTSRILELEALLVRMYVPLLTAEAARRAEAMLLRLLSRLAAKQGNRGVAVHCWSYVDRYLLFSARHFMASIADFKGEHGRAAGFRRKSLESARDPFWLQTALTLEQYLRAEGRAEEADEIARERLKVPVFDATVCDWPTGDKRGCKRFEGGT